MRVSYEMLSDKSKKEHEKFTKTTASLSEANQVNYMCMYVV